MGKNKEKVGKFVLKRRKKIFKMLMEMRTRKDGKVKGK